MTVQTLLYLLVFIIALGVCWWLVKLIPLPEPLPRIVDVLFILVAVFYVLNALFGFAPSLRFR